MPTFEVLSGTKYIVHDAKDAEEACEKVYAFFAGEEVDGVEEIEVTTWTEEVEE